MYDRSVPGELNRIKRQLQQIAKGQRVAHGASVENAAIEVRDDSGSLRAIYGQQADGTSGIQVVNGPPPPAPSAPIVASVLGGVTVSWDGAFAGGAVIQLDWARIEVHASTTPGFTATAATLQSTIETAQGATVVVVTDDPVYVQLVARNTSGAASPSSAEAGPYGPTPVVADDILDGIVTTVKLADEAVSAAKVKLGAIGADQLALGLGNLAPDPSFEGIRTEALIEGLPDWSVVTPGNNSAKALHVDCTSGATTWKNIELGRFPVLPGERHYLALDYKASATFDGSGIKILFRYEDASAAVLGYGVADETVVPGAAWDHATNQVQAPVGTTTAVLLVEASEVTAGEAWFDNIEVRTLVAAGMVAANTITANELTAGAVTTAKLDALAVTADKIAALAITTGKLDALAVTSDKLAANSVTAGKIAAGTVDATAISAGAITTAKLAAGAVDATSLAADAITGKTITGGTITGTDINGSTITGGVLQTGTSGSRVVITPTPPEGVSTRPSALLYSGVTGEVYPAVFNAGPNASNSAQPVTAIGSPVIGQDSSSNYTQALIALGAPKAGTAAGIIQMATNNPTGTSELGYFAMDAQSATTTSGASHLNLYVQDGSSTGKHSSIYVTGDYVNINANNVTHTFTSTGLALTGEITASDNTWTSYTPTVSGAGSATWTTRDGWYYKLGKIVFIGVYLQASGAGSGTSNVTITLPSTPYRGSSANRRQRIGCHAGAVTAGTNSSVSGSFNAVVFAGGSGAQIDRFSGPTGIDLRGDNVAATTIITMDGWYREA